MYRFLTRVTVDREGLMTTEDLVGNPAVSNEAQSVDQTVSAPEAPVEANPTLATSEKMLSQSEVNRLVSAIKKESYDKGMAAAKTSSEQAVPSQPTVPAQPEATSTQYSPEKVQELVRNEMMRAQEAQSLADQERKQQAELQQLVAELKPKIDEAATKYDDFRDKVSPQVMEEVLQVNPALLVYANQVDNSGDVLYEVMKHPEKLAMLNNLSGIPSQAVTYVKGIAKSIKDRDAAKSAPQQPQPLNTLKPSTVGAGDGPMTVADYKNFYAGKC